MRGRYKGSDTFGSLGPWLVTKDDVEQPDDLTVRCRMGNDIVAEDSTRYYNFKVAEIISFISQFQTLQPGDIIALWHGIQTVCKSKIHPQRQFSNHRRPGSGYH